MHMLDRFSGAVADLPPARRSDADVISALRIDPRVSHWDMSEVGWLRSSITSLQRRGKIRFSGGQFPWLNIEVVNDAQEPGG